MKLFECQNCGQLLYFENTRCESCGYVLGYMPDRESLSVLAAANDGRLYPLATPREPFRLCANAAYDACNWLVAASGDQAYCFACRFNRTVPNLEVPRNILLWQRLEAAKHRLVYGLLRFGLQPANRYEDPSRGLAFEFLASSETMFQEGPQVITGHSQGIITLDISEADDAERERHRRDMLEPYRTLLGHFRHEVGHYYWERLVRDGVWYGAFQQMFGDERRDYRSALQTHYENGPQPGWQQTYVSSYASAHPWEDFAETWAHYMHMVDTLETAAAFGLRVSPHAGRDPALEMAIDFDPYGQANFDALVAAWLPLTYAVNSLNHSMGQQDLYPFVLAPTVMGKLRFVHGLIHGNCSASPREVRTHTKKCQPL